MERAMQRPKMKVKIISYEFYASITEAIPALIGNETIYPEDFLEPFIKTFTRFDRENTNMTNYYFNITTPELDVYLQPKYTFNNFNEMMGCNCIIVSNEIFEQYFQTLTEDCDFNLVYNLPDIDIISLTKTDGDFPQDNSIDLLLTNYLESCIIINHLQEFTLSFETNVHPFKNFITFQISNITYKTEPVKRLDDRMEEIQTTIDLNKNLYHIEYDIGLDECHNKVINFNWHYFMMDKKQKVGLVANNEVKIDFIVPVPIPVSVPESVRELQKARNETIQEKPIFQSKGLVMNETVEKPLTKEELRLKRIQNMDK